MNTESMRAEVRGDGCLDGENPGWLQMSDAVPTAGEENGGAACGIPERPAPLPGEEGPAFRRRPFRLPDIPIRELRLSAQAGICLTNAGYTSAAQLSDITLDELLAIRDMEENTAREILDRLVRTADGEPLPGERTSVRRAPPGLPDIPIQALDLSMRAANCLLRAGYTSAAELSGVTLDTLLALRNLGEGTAREILDQLERIEGVRQLPGEENAVPCGAPYDLPDIPIQDLNLSARACNCLRHAGYTSAAQLSGVTLDTLLATRNLGEITAREILDRLTRLAHGERPSGERSLEFCRAPSGLPDIPVRDLGLPARGLNRLLRAGYTSAAQLSGITLDELMAFQSLGEGTAREILDRLAQVADGEQVSEEEAAARYRAPPDLPDIPIRELGLPERTINCLFRAGYASTAQLSGITLDVLLTIRNLREDTAQEVLERLRELREKDGMTFSEAKALCGTIPDASASVLIKSFVSFTGLSREYVLRQLAVCRRSHPEADGAELSRLLCLRDPIRQNIQRGILQILAREGKGMTRQALLEHLPCGTAEAALDDFLAGLAEQKQVILRGDLVERRCPTVLEFAESIRDRRSCGILLARLHGRTRREIGKRWRITQERVQQITMRTLRNRPRLREDRYLYMFNRYEFTCETFCLSFDEPAAAYYYLELLRTGVDRRPLQELLSDGSVSMRFRQKVERFLSGGRNRSVSAT